nr:MAG TPA: hypothetical protein [Bacteriophage sp.]
MHSKSDVKKWHQRNGKTWTSGRKLDAPGKYVIGKLSFLFSVSRPRWETRAVFYCHYSRVQYHPSQKSAPVQPLAFGLGAFLFLLRFQVYFFNV